jgi:hypothetical protein
LADAAAEAVDAVAVADVVDRAGPASRR